MTEGAGATAEAGVPVGKGLQAKEGGANTARSVRDTTHEKLDTKRPVTLVSITGVAKGEGDELTESTGAGVDVKLDTKVVTSPLKTGEVPLEMIGVVPFGGVGKGVEPLTN